MRVTLVLEEAPHAQATTRRTVEAGDLVIGRGADADWRIEDPDMYVSRTHCVVTVEGGEAVVRDASRGGLFVDGARAPLGPGNAAHLEDGMRLRLGDFVLRVDLAKAAEEADAVGEAPAPGGFVWADAPASAEPPPRPEDLPAPFDERPAIRRPEETNGAGFDFDDPFTLDPPPAPDGPSGRRDPFGLGADDEDAKPRGPIEEGAPDPGDPFGWNVGAPEDAPEGRTEPGPGAESDPFTWAAPSAGGPVRGAAAEPIRSPNPPPSPDDASAAGPGRSRVLERPPPERRRPRREAGEPLPPPGPTATAPDPDPEAFPPSADDAALLAAFFRGLGLDPPPSANGAAEMEAMGARFRLLAEGLTALLRARAQEKRSARVAQTVIGSAEVNPLKFVASTDEAVSALAARRGPGYLEPEAAIRASFRDLHDHERRKWEALQQALRRMVDRFDPEAVEREMADVGLLGTLLAGGRGAKLWGLYQERYREIARAAEDRFLGEVGADFRDAYEGGDP